MAHDLIAMLFCSVLFVFAGVQSTPVRRDTSAGQCSMPTAQQLRQRLLGPGGGASFEPSFTTPTHSAVNQTCPSGAIISDSMAVNARSSCPWQYQAEDVPERFPRVINRAVCRCSKCLDLTTGHPIADSSCTPVMYNMKVLNRVGCQDGVYTYEMQHIEVPVACSCSRPVITPSS